MELGTGEEGFRGREVPTVSLSRPDTPLLWGKGRLSIALALTQMTLRLRQVILAP